MSKKYTRKNKRHRVKRGGNDDDIEMGKIQDFEYMKNIPPDPKRFEEYNKKILKNIISRSSSPAEVAAVFDKPIPEAQSLAEQKMMFNEDPLNMDPFEREKLEIFSSKGGKRKKTSKRRYKRKNTSKRRYKNKK